VQIDIRWGENNVERTRQCATELVALMPDVVLAAGFLSVTAVQHIRPTLPIVFVTVVDPVGAGLVDSLDRPGGSTHFSAIQGAAQSHGVDVSPVGVRDAAEIERAVATFARSANGGLIVEAVAGASVYRELIIELAARHKQPAVYADSYIVAEGGLISYRPDRKSRCDRIC
jgi:putative ABC transport system substrate-binding protein